MNKYAEIYNTNKCLGRDGLIKNDNIAVIRESEIISCKDVFNLFWEANTNILYVADDEGGLAGVITNKYLLKQVKENIQEKPYINKACTVVKIKEDAKLFVEASELFETNHITTAIPVIDKMDGVVCEIRKVDYKDERKIITEFHTKITKYEKSYYLKKEIAYLRKLLEEQDIVVIGTEEQFDDMFGNLILNKCRVRFIQRIENAYNFLLDNQCLLIDLSPIGYKGRNEIYQYCNNGYSWNQFMTLVFEAIESEYCSKFYQITDNNNEILYDFLKKYMVGVVSISRRNIFTNVVINYMAKQHFAVTERKETCRTDYFQYVLKLNGIEVNKARGDSEFTLIEYVDIVSQLYELNQKLSDKVLVLNFAFDECVDATNAEQLRMKMGKYEGNSHFSDRLYNYSELYSMGEHNREYLMELTKSLCFKRTRTFENNQVVFEDINSRLVQIENGIRRTCHQPEYYSGTIYFLGGCTVWGWLVEDQYTIPSLIQKNINQTGTRYRVVNLGNGNVINVVNLLKNISVNENDIFICLFPFLTDKVKREIPIIELGAQFNKIRKTKYKGIECFFNMVHHCGTNGNILYSEIIFAELKKYLKGVSQKKYIQKNSLYKLFRSDIKDLDIFYDYKSYVTELKSKSKKVYNDKHKTIGCVVMNCNPFTLGHRYLIEYAIGKVDYLYLFIVEENKSYFSFADRYEMVKKGTEDLDNILVMRSGRMLASMSTFPAYFQRNEIMQVEEKISVSMDLKVFSQYIAPIVNIQYRFVGEEIADIVTALYNKKMKEILPEFGISVTEIPRKCIGGKEVSASVVRECYKKKDLKNLSKWVPDTTLQYLIKLWDYKKQ